MQFGSLTTNLPGSDLTHKAVWRLSLATSLKLLPYTLLIPENYRCQAEGQYDLITLHGEDGDEDRE